MPFDPHTLLDLLPALASLGGNPQYRDSVMQGFLHTRRQFEQEALLKQQNARQDQMAQAEIANRQADNERADKMLALQQGNSDLTRLEHFRNAAGQQAGQIALTANDPLAAQNELAAQGIGLRKDFGVPPTTMMPTPNMAGMITNRDKKRAQDILTGLEKDKTYAEYVGKPELENMTIQFKNGEMKKVSELRQIAGSQLYQGGQPAVPSAKRERAFQSKEMLVQGQPAAVNFDPSTGEYFDQGGGQVKVAPIPPKPNAGDEPLSPDDVQGAAQAILSGRMAPSQLSLVGGMGNRGVKFKQAVVAAVNKQKPDYNWAEAESGYQFGKSTGTQTTVRMIDNIEQSIPLLLKASDDFSRSGVRVINQATLAVKDQFGDTSVSAFNAARLGLADEIAKILSGGGTGSTTSDAKLKQANDLLAADMTPQQLRATVGEVQQLLGNRRTSLTKGTFMEKKGTEPAKRIRVRRKADGQTGTVLDSDFDPAKYDKVGP